MTAEELKAWLKSIGKDRNWLASECRVAKKTVDGWLSDGRPIPGPVTRILEMLKEGK